MRLYIEDSILVQVTTGMYHNLDLLIAAIRDLKLRYT